MAGDVIAPPGNPHEDTGPYSVWWPNKLIGRVDVRIEQVINLLWNRGIRAVWETASKCPCGSYMDNSPNSACPVCDGTGWEFTKPQIVRVTATGMVSETNLFDRASMDFDHGTIQLSVRPEHAPKKRDRITLLDCRISLEDTRVRSASGYDALRYPICPAEYLDKDQNPYQVSVLHIRVGSADGGVAVEDKYNPVLGTDFEITEDGLIDWAKGDITGKAPEVGVPYTVVYKTRPVYRVLQHPHVSRDTRTAWKSGIEKHQFLPVQVLCGFEWESTL